MNSLSIRWWYAFAAALLTVSTISGADAQPPDFITFESGQVRPLAMSPDGNRLFAVNTPDGYLEIFDLTFDYQATKIGSVLVVIRECQQLGQVFNKLRETSSKSRMEESGRLVQDDADTFIQRFAILMNWIFFWGCGNWFAVFFTLDILGMLECSLTEVFRLFMKDTTEFFVFTTTIA